MTPPTEQFDAGRDDNLARLWRGYWDTHYMNDALVLVPGTPAPFSGHGQPVVLWLTADNPHSVQQDAARNRQARHRLLEAMRSLLEDWAEHYPSKNPNGKPPVRIEPADAVHPAREWPAEHGFFVFLPEDMWQQHREDWHQLAQHFGQNAIVVAEPGKTVRIEVTDPLFRQKLVKSGQPLTLPLPASSAAGNPHGQ
jgi:hypothetical protein